MEFFKDTSVKYLLGHYESLIRDAINRFSSDNIHIRIWKKDHTVWFDGDFKGKEKEIIERLGWLDLPIRMQSEYHTLTSASDEAKTHFKRCVLLGMGGSSLAPFVFSKIFGKADAYPRLTVLDSTHPLSIESILQEHDLRDTLFIVSSKSGGTIETISLFDLFYYKLSELMNNPHRNFWIITDRGSKLEPLAQERGIENIFYAPEDVGGRYSVFSFFGMLPGAVMGLDFQRALSRAIDMMNRCSGEVSFAQNPGLILGTVLGALSLRERDKLILSGSPEIFPITAWLEQLIAESTGKDQKGILPVPEKKLISFNTGDDQVIVYFRVRGSSDPLPEEHLQNLSKSGHPVIIIQLEDIYDIFSEFYRWEMATAMAGAVLGINPFDQPNVELAKKRTSEIISAWGRKEPFYDEPPIIMEDGISLYGLSGEFKMGSLSHAVESFLAQAGSGDYISIMAYLPINDRIDQLIEDLRIVVRERTGIVTTASYGPRYLHSTGQLHKGDGGKGLFVVITHKGDRDIPIPERSYGFQTLIMAQAMGDYLALKERGRRVIRIDMPSEFEDGMNRLINCIKNIEG